MATIAADMKSQGKEVINFSVGEPDFNTPKHIIEAAKSAMDAGYTKYTAGPGMLEFREAICNKLIKENEIKYDPKDVLVSNGEKQSLYTACQALFDKGDNVIVFTPYWVSFQNSFDFRMQNRILSKQFQIKISNQTLNNYRIRKIKVLKELLLTHPQTLLEEFGEMKQ